MEAAELAKHTLSEIVRANIGAGYQFFDRTWLEWFGQRISDFAVYQYQGRVFVHARSRGFRIPLTRKVCHPWTVAEFDPATGNVVGVKLGDEIILSEFTDAQDIEEALEAYVDGEGVV